ncbi:hypothetical protein [Microbispora sp. NPDC049633]|uniref:hypothetical protein n=1 Tax=Microbispora sp. NPDC049633 TaxID=3154355 RepID=UPI0034426CB2
MAVFLGDKHRFGVEIGEWVNPLLRRVDLWAADQWLTCDDNLAFAMQFRLSVTGTANWLRSGPAPHPPFSGLSPVAAHRRLVGQSADFEEEHRRHEIFHWGPTTDNLRSFLFRNSKREDELVITFDFWREEHLLEHPEHAGRVFAAELRTKEFIGILDELAEVVGPD